MTNPLKPALQALHPALAGMGEGVPAAIHLKLPYPPPANRLWRTNPHARGNFPSTEYKAFKEAVSRYCLERSVKPFPADLVVAVHINIYRPIRSGDLDGRLKGLLDALNSLAWADDKQITEIHAYRYDDKDNPRAEVLIVPLERVPDKAAQRTLPRTGKAKVGQ